MGSFGYYPNKEITIVEGLGTMLIIKSQFGKFWVVLGTMVISKSQFGKFWVVLGTMVISKSQFGKFGVRW